MPGFKQQTKINNDNNLALEQMYLGNYEEAEKLFISALSKTEKDDVVDKINILNNLGLMHENMQDYETALKYYNESQSYSDSGSAGYNSIAGKILVLQDNSPKAIEYFNKALEIDVNDFDSNNILGLIYLGDLGEKYLDYPKVLIHNEKAYSLNSSPTMMQNLALNYYFVSSYDDALPLLLEICKTQPANSIAKYFAGLIYYINQDQPKAKKYITEAITLNPELDNDEIKAMIKE